MSEPTQPLPADQTAIILDSVADGVFTVDRDWRITTFNRAAEQITGIPRDEAVGRPCCAESGASRCTMSAANPPSRSRCSRTRGSTTWQSDQIPAATAARASITELEPVEMDAPTPEKFTLDDRGDRG